MEDVKVKDACFNLIHNLSCHTLPLYINLKSHVLFLYISNLIDRRVYENSKIPDINGRRRRTGDVLINAIYLLLMIQRELM